ncbi:MAG: hypothetical protein H8E84_04540 [Flavobacteriales bacterium]|nr:hypothetical protein [Flavobacteriales bacterium]
MKQSKILILTTVIFIFFLCSCKTKNQCPAYDEPSSKKEEKDGTKYKLILLKDGKKVGVNNKKRNKKAKQKLFKKKVLN